MRFLSLIGAVLCIVIAAGFSVQDWGWLISLMMVPAAVLLARHAFSRRKLPPDVVLALGGVRWKEEDFCRGWEIDGRTGSGKTASAVVPIIHQLKQNRPEVGILTLDTKGDLSEPLARIADDLNCRDSLVQLEVRPEDASADWKPAVTMNFLADTSIPIPPTRKSSSMWPPPPGKRAGRPFSKSPHKPRSRILSPHWLRSVVPSPSRRAPRSSQARQIRGNGKGLARVVGGTA